MRCRTDISHDLGRNTCRLSLTTAICNLLWCWVGNDFQMDGFIRRFWDLMISLFLFLPSFSSFILTCPSSNYHAGENLSVQCPYVRASIQPSLPRRLSKVLDEPPRGSTRKRMANPPDSNRRMYKLMKIRSTSSNGPPPCFPHVLTLSISLTLGQSLLVCVRLPPLSPEMNSSFSFSSSNQ